MNILLTGATGFIGKHLFRRLINSNYNISVIIRDNKLIIGDEDNLVKNIPTFILDGDINNLYSFIKKQDIDGVINLVGDYYKENSLDDIEPLINSNTLFGTQVLDIASRLKVKWFINTGSYYQNVDSIKYNPLNLYAATKEAFISISKYYTNVSRIKFITLKLTDTFGLNDKRNKIWNLWRKMLIGNSKQIKALDMSLGKQIIALNYIDNIVDAYIALINLLEDNKITANNETFFMNSEERYSLRELANIFEDISGKKLSINWGAIDDISSKILKPIKPNSLIPNFKPKISLIEGVKEFLKDI